MSMWVACSNVDSVLYDHDSSKAKSKMCVCILCASLRVVASCVCGDADADVDVVARCVVPRPALIFVLSSHLALPIVP